MVEFDTSKIGYSLKLDGKYYNTLDIEGFSHMMKDSVLLLQVLLVGSDCPAYCGRRKRNHF